MINDYVKILRPLQWLKNLMLFFPPFLGGALFTSGEIYKGVVPFFSFCLVSSATYVLNDIVDVEADARHPKKKNRPIPSGRISKRGSAIFAAFLMVLGICVGIYVSSQFFLVLVWYVLLTLAYSFYFKQMPVVDIFCISAGFLLRLYAGGVVFSIVISEWLFLSVFLLAIFLSAGKRCGELTALGEDAGAHRKSLAKYPPGLLEGIMYMTGATVLVTYTMYVITRPVLIYTVPLCSFGLMRYLYRVKSGCGGDPTESLVKDVPICITGFVWAIWVGWSLY